MQVIEMMLVNSLQQEFLEIITFQTAFGNDRHDPMFLHRQTDRNILDIIQPESDLLQLFIDQNIFRFFIRK